jgi:acyl-coenzyme A synthetase/AMP-(fatty) acid ligase
MTRVENLIELLQSYSAQPCIDGEGGARSYAELISEIEQWNARFVQLNVLPGTVVAVRADYSMSAMGALISLLSLRAIAALIPRDRADEHYLKDSHASALLDLRTDGGYEWLPLTQPAPHPLLAKLRDQGHGGILLFTSGSTGRPKAALHSAERFLYKFRKPGRRFRTLAFLLFDHVAGLDTMFYTLVSGGTLVLTRQRDPKSIARLIETCKVEVLPTSPTFLRLFCLADSAHQHDFSSLQIITYGSEPMDPATLTRVNEQFPTAKIVQKFGTTETGAPKTISRGNDSLWIKFNTEGFETKIVDGVLWIRSESTLLGYLNALSPVDDEGWYCTSDLVDVDGEWIRFRGRASDTINVGGEKVTASEVEHSILELDFVREVLVCGEPHALLGQVVTAKVVLASDDMDRKTATMSIWRHCRARLASYKAPVKIDIVSGALADERQKIRRQQPLKSDPH